MAPCMWFDIYTLKKNSNVRSGFRLHSIVNIGKQLFTERLLPLFETKRASVNYGGPCKRNETKRGRRPQLSSIYLIGLALWYLNGSDSIYHLCPIFGIIPSTAYIRVDYALEVLYRALCKNIVPDFEVRWFMYTKWNNQLVCLGVIDNIGLH